MVLKTEKGIRKQINVSTHKLLHLARHGLKIGPGRTLTEEIYHHKGPIQRIYLLVSIVSHIFITFKTHTILVNLRNLDVTFQFCGLGICYTFGEICSTHGVI